MKNYALIGEKLSHSLSPEIHSKLGSYNYELCEVKKNDLEKLLSNDDISGYNITIPYKKEIINYCSSLSEVARDTMSVNTIIKDSLGLWHGDNTDAYGFYYMINRSGVDFSDKKVLVLGSGGASLSVCYVLKKLNVREIVVISRKGQNSYENIERHIDCDIIVNTTPVGMYPDTLISPVDLSVFSSLLGVFDLIYNPQRTKLILDAQKLNIPTENGLSMLVAQAKKASELFQKVELDDTLIEKIIWETNHKNTNIVLVGMASCGKSYIGEVLAKKLDRCFVDIDKEIEKEYSLSPSEIITNSGEEYFREIETKVLSRFAKEKSLVIATGGGVVTREENYQVLKQQGFIIWLERDIKELTTVDRVLSAKYGISRLYEERKPLYEMFSDIVVKNDVNTDVVSKIVEMYNNEDFSY